MRKFSSEFLRRGAIACGIGPLILAVLYLILHQQGRIDVLSVGQVCTGIFSLSALAFVAGGMNAVYQIERLPLMAAVLIHGTVLYLGYLAAYLINGWLETGATPILVFTVIFIVGYLLIWAVIYTGIRRKTEQLNRMLKKQQESGNDPVL